MVGRSQSLACTSLTYNGQRYPLETIYILPGNQFSGKLKPNQVAALLKITTMKPEQAKMNLQRGLHELHTNDLQRRLVASWNLDVGTNQMTVPARILAPPNVVYSE